MTVKKIVHPIVDLHCDLLVYLTGDSSRSPYDTRVRCAIPQLRQGQVKVQVMALFTQTEANSTLSGMAQAQVFTSLPEKYPEEFFAVKREEDLQNLASQKRIGILPAIENGSIFCEETEPLQEGFKRLNSLMALMGKPVYISLTWNGENRFGGGCGNETGVGLKPDGERLLDFLHEKKIAVDFSHTSDQLAEGILTYIDRRNLGIPVIASHSNFRSIASVPRNLPDEFAKEIVRRQGIIGLNFVKPFVGGDSLMELSKHVDHLVELKGESHLAFGADFFFEEDIPADKRRPPGSYFFHDGQDASCYVHFLQKLGVEEPFGRALAHENALTFLRNSF